MMHLNLDLNLALLSNQARFLIMIVLCNFFAKHFTIVRVKAQLDQMIDGLKLLIYDLIKANPCSMHKLFTTKPAPITLWSREVGSLHV